MPRSPFSLVCPVNVACFSPVPFCRVLLQFPGQNWTQIQGLFFSFLPIRLAPPPRCAFLVLFPPPLCHLFQRTFSSIFFSAINGGGFSLPQPFSRRGLVWPAPLTSSFLAPQTLRPPFPADSGSFLGVCFFVLCFHAAAGFWPP